MPCPAGRHRRAKAAGQPALFDFRPVLRNRSAFAYSLAYCVHTLEMNALRGWGVAFLAWVAVHSGMTRRDCCRPPSSSPCSALLGTLTSVLGNEASIRFGRRRLIVGAMVLSIAVGLLLGFVGSTGYWLAVVLIVVYGMIVWLDFLVAHRGRGRRGRSGAPRRHARRAFDAGLRRRLRRPAGDRLDARRSPAACRQSPGASPSASSPFSWRSRMAVFIAIRPRELEGDRGG